ncbi:nitrate reductase molybdenum cofactor assembly chaperone [Acidiferrimicrobium sp. IK]|uniref:nitrate reductase molybdenum cofactor assembly chaperone n=1 Tax=Acidiferrimicrobium sp. IK TaxID=2871700 RepID=UPI0021CB5856|nr:nitrate reductase molybdenum cofactor assembly chaperone [Acidiferrimicrobium sp. IK]MCU4185265.1 nitrate reductase molybdenum cofactor assembly chaperone [Acidiferrimicrobium sp. IK]
MRFRNQPTAAPAPAPDPALDRTRVLAAVSLLVGYPDEELLAQIPSLAAAASQIGEPAGPLLSRFVTHLATTPLDRLGADYVDTFDLRRRCCLYLTYYAHGDTRKRGAALVRFTHAYRRAGCAPPDGELADHLGVVCNFAALTADGVELLDEHRAGVELLRAALAERDSPYVDVVDALRAVLGEPTESDLTAMLELARSGPPGEEVGLEPFGPPEQMGGRR